MTADTPLPADEMRRRTAELRDLVSATAETATAPDRSVTVTAGPRGAVLALELTERAVRLDPVVLGATIVETARAAAARVRERLDAGVAMIGVPDAGIAAALHGDLPPVERPAAPAFSAAAFSAAASSTGDEDLVEPTFALKSTFPSVEGLEEAIDRLTADAQAAWTAYEQARDRLATLTGDGFSSDGSVRATVAADGLSAVAIDESAMRHGPAVLGRLVLTAIHQAGASLAAATAGVAQAAAPRLDLGALVRDHLPEGFTPPSDGFTSPGEERRR